MEGISDVDKEVWIQPSPEPELERESSPQKKRIVTPLPAAVPEDPGMAVLLGGTLLGGSRLTKRAKRK